MSTDDKATKELLEAQENAALFIASMTGVKAQFQDAGWSEQGAEVMTAELFRKLVTAPVAS